MTRLTFRRLSKPSSRNGAVVCDRCGIYAATYQFTMEGSMFAAWTVFSCDVCAQPFADQLGAQLVEFEVEPIGPFAPSKAGPRKRQR